MAERNAQQQERQIQRRQRLDDYVDGQYARATDPATKDRLSSIANFQIYFDELANRLASAGSNEEVAELTEALRQGQLDQRDLIWDQQRAMIADLAYNNGLTDPAAQAQLADQIIRTLNSPFFSQRRAFLGAKPLID